jgi:hypothetical protein
MSLGRDHLSPQPGEHATEMVEHDAEGAERAFYGRRKGKRLRAGQEQRLTELLPALRLTLPPPGEFLDRFPPTRSGSRSGSAAASISRPRRRAPRAPASSVPSPS